MALWTTFFFCDVHVHNKALWANSWLIHAFHLILYYLTNMWNESPQVSWLITSAFFKNPILDALIKGELISYLVPLMLTLLSSFHVCSKYICDCKDDALHHEYATWLQGHQSNKEKVYLNLKLDCLSFCVSTLHNMA